MRDNQQPAFDFIAAENAAEDGEALIIELEHYEGPLHVLLALARNQKVDLLQLSVTKLADQYLAFIRGARRIRISLAGDYLVMAAWLAYLKSRLLLPKPSRASGNNEPPAEELAAALAFRLAKLDAMRRAVETLNARPQLGRDVFTRGDPEAARITGDHFEYDLYALVQAYAAQRRRDEARRYKPRAPQAYPLEEARARLRGKLNELGAWTSLAAVAPKAGAPTEPGPTRASYVASTLSAGLEMVREGELEVRQIEPFAEIYLRARGLHLEAAE